MDQERPRKKSRGMEPYAPPPAAGAPPVRANGEGAAQLALVQYMAWYT